MTVHSLATATPILLGNGATTEFPFGFSAGSASEVRVYTDGAITTDAYSVLLNGDSEGGTVTFDIAPSNGTEIVIASNPDFAQDIAFGNSGPFLAESVDDGLDQSARRSLYLLSRLGETVRAPEGEAIAALPPPPDRTGTVFGFSLFTGIRELLTYSNLSTLLAPFLTPLLSAINKGDPGGNVMSVGLFLAGSSISVSTGTNIVRTSGYSVDGKGGALYQYDAAVDAAYVTAHPRSAFVSANGRGFRLSLDQLIKVTMFGAVGNDTANDGAAFVAAFNFCWANALSGAGFAKGAPSLGMPIGQYYLGAQPLDIIHTIDFYGEGTAGPGGGSAVQLRHDDGVNGIRTQGGDTSGDSTTGAQSYPGAYSSKLRNFSMKGGYAGTEGEHHAILMRAKVTVEDVHIENWSGDGIAILSVNGGNNNGFRIRRVSVEQCRDGIRADGSNSNIGSGMDLDLRILRRAGIKEGNDLGNLWHGVIEECAKTPGVTPSYVSHGGNWYAVVAGQEAGASTNAPSGSTADNTWWYYMNAGDAFPGGNVPDWVSGITVRAGGPILHSSNNNQSVFLAVWTEAFQGPAQVVWPAQFIGGNQLSGVKGISRWRQSGAGLVAEKARVSQQLLVGPEGGEVSIPTPGQLLFENYQSSTTITFRRWTDASNTAIDGVIQADVNGLSLEGGIGVNLFANPGTGLQLIARARVTGFDILTGSLLVAGTKVVGAQQPAINNVTGGAVVDTEARAAINLMLAAWRTHGGIAT